jgi:AraC family transcriptional regulator
MSLSYERRVEPLALGWRSFAWGTGIFDTAHRRYTRNVEGTIRVPQHLVMVTLRGGASALEVTSSCGHRYAGPDHAGTVSFVPAHCERRLSLRDVDAEWASISLSPELFDSKLVGERGAGGAFDISAFTNRDDPFVAAMLSEMTRLNASDGALDPTYCDTMSWALSRYLARRYGQVKVASGILNSKLAPWRVRRVEAYIDAHLAESIRIAELAALVGVSLGFFHRAFQLTLGKTPLDFINQRRVQYAMQCLQRDDAQVAAIAIRVGFASPSHFSRVFRQFVGISPSEFRRRNHGRHPPRNPERTD